MATIHFSRFLELLRVRSYDTPLAIVLAAAASGLALSPAPESLPRPLPPEKPYSISAEELAGDWNSTFGEMKLTVDGRNVSGTYIYSAGTKTVTGTVRGHLQRAGRIELTWKEAPSAEGHAIWYAIDRDSLIGKWGIGKSYMNGGEWRLQRNSTDGATQTSE